MKYSVVIPVFNSQAIVGETVDRTCAFFEGEGLDYELLLVNDASRDGSWGIIQQKAEANPKIIAIDLLRNSGQHSANYCGFQHSTGDYVVTMDDDLQNPPEEIKHLIAKAAEVISCRGAISALSFTLSASQAGPLKTSAVMGVASPRST